MSRDRTRNKKETKEGLVRRMMKGFITNGADREERDSNKSFDGMCNWGKYNRLGGPDSFSEPHTG